MVESRVPPRSADRHGALAPIRGRDTQLAAIDDVIIRLAARRGSVVVIEGPPGIGKSRFLREVVARSGRIGARVLTGAAFEDQQSVPFGPLLTAMLRTTPPIADLDTLRTAETRQDLGYWVVQELEAAIAKAAATAPLVIAIDDIHWADAGTLLALRAMVPGSTRMPILWALAARRSEGRPAVREMLAALGANSEVHLQQVELGALKFDAVAHIATDVLGRQADPALLELAGRAHGNPFLVLELLRGLREEGRISLTDERALITGRDLPHRLAETMDQRLQRLSPASRHVVEVAAILPASFSVSALARLLEQSTAQLYASVAEALRADLFVADGDSLRFRHDLLRQAARQSIPHAVRRAMERESAQILLDLGAGPAEVAYQLARSADVGDAAAVATLRDAADSLTSSDPRGAADLGLRALDLVRHDDPTRPAIVAETVERLIRAARNNEARRLADAELSTTGLPSEAEARVLQSLSMTNESYANLRLDENRRALELPGLTPQTRARLLGYLAYNLMFDGQTRAARQAAATAREAATEAGEAHGLALADVVLANLDFADGRGVECVRRIDALTSMIDESALGLLVASHVANLQYAVGKHDEPSALLDLLIEATRQHHHVEGEAIYTQLRATGELLAGRPAGARTLIESLPDGQRLCGEGTAAQIGTVTLAAVAAHTGDQQLQRTISEWVRAAIGRHTAPHREAVRILAHFAWQNGDIDGAAHWLGEDVELLGTPVGVNHLGHVVLAARMVSVSGDAGLRLRVLTALAMLDSDQPGIPLFSAVAQHVRGLLDQDVAAVLSAADSLAITGRPLLHAAALEDAGRFMARAGTAAEAIDTLSAAFDIYRDSAAVSDARRVARVLQELGVSRRAVRRRSQTGWSSLTAAETRVVDLVAAGASNKEVAELLSVSPNTVNTHLRRAFTKLGVHSRGELSTAVNEVSSPPTGDL